MPLHSVVIALGSNLGPRERLLREALWRMRLLVTVVRTSRVHETKPVDAPQGSPDFLNMVIAGFTDLTAEELLSGLKEIEQAMGRRSRIRNGPRPIDLDIVLFSALVLRSARITIPHPRYRERDFVTAPLRELALPWVDPVTGCRVGRVSVSPDCSNGPRDGATP